MYRLGLTPVTGRRGTVVRLRDQLHRLFSTTIRWTYTDEAAGRDFGLLQALEELFGREIDLLTERSLRNPYFIGSIEKTRQLLCAA